MRTLILSMSCVAGLSLSACQASAGGFSLSVYRPGPVIVRPAPAYYPPLYQPYYYPPAYVQPAPIYVAPRPAYYPYWNPRPHHHHHHHHQHGHNHGRR